MPRPPAVLTTTPDMHRLVKAVFSGKRASPLVVVSCMNTSGDPLVDPERVRKVAEPAPVVVLGTELSRPFAHAMPPGFEVYNGALRVYAPKASRKDSKYSHPLLVVRAGEPWEQRLRDALQDVQPAPHTPAQPTFSDAPQATSSPVTSPPSPPACKGMDQGMFREIVREEVAAVLADSLRAKDATVSKLEKRNKTLEERVKELRCELSSSAESDLPRVFADPVKQLRWEVGHIWLTKTPEEERNAVQWSPLDPEHWAIGPNFISSVEEAPAPRGKVIRVMIEVITGSVWDRRSGHIFRESECDPNAVTRPSDGAVMYRANVKSNTPGAPRIHWWGLPSGQPEFVHVGHHDDLPPRQ